MEMQINKPAKLSSDPRIDSPVVRVVYPASPVSELQSGKITVETTAPQSNTTEQAVEKSTPVQSSTEASTSPTPQPMTLGSWLEVIKSNAAVFLSVGLLCLAIGYVIGKNKA